MIQSKLILKKQEIERLLRNAQYSPIDPARKRFLVAKLLELERGIAALGFDKSDIERNDFAEPTIVSKQVLVEPPSWGMQGDASSSRQTVPHGTDAKYHAGCVCPECQRAHDVTTKALADRKLANSIKYK